MEGDGSRMLIWTESVSSLIQSIEPRLHVSYICPESIWFKHTSFCTSDSLLAFRR